MMWPACPRTFEAVFCEPLGKEGRALRAELGRLVHEVRDARGTASDALGRCAAIKAGLRSGHATEIAAMQAGIARCRDRLGAALARISELGRRPAEHEGGHNPDDTVLIAALGAEAAELRRRIRYYESPSSRRGMPSLLGGREKRFSEAIARSCRRNGGTGAPIGPPMGHRGRSHRAKAEWTEEYGPAGRCGRRGSVVAVPPRSSAGCTASSKRAQTSCAAYGCAGTALSAPPAGT